MNSDEIRNQIVWNKFSGEKKTLPTEKRDYKEWHRGRTNYSLWTILVQSQTIQDRFDLAKAHLAEYLLTPYSRQTHVTLFVCGFLADTKRWDDDYPTVTLKHHHSMLSEAGFGPFEIEIGGINSFKAAPFIEVFDVEGGIEKVRSVILADSIESREETYVPHLTLGLYRDYFDTKAVADKISLFRTESRIRYRVDAIRLMSYAAREIAGPLVTECEIHFDGKRNIK